MVILIREIEGGTDSNNRKITVITICIARGRVQPAGKEEVRLRYLHINIYM